MIHAYRIDHHIGGYPNMLVCGSYGAHTARAIHEATLLLATVAENKVASCIISSCVLLATVACE